MIQKILLAFIFLRSRTNPQGKDKEKKAPTNKKYERYYKYIAITHVIASH